MRRPEKLLVSLSLSALVLLGAPAALSANEGLDPSFGGSGILATPIGPTGTTDVALAAALQSDGKIVLAGNSGSGTSFGSGGDFALARYGADGTLDPAFGTGGKVVTSFAANPDASDEAHAVVIQPDGKIVAAGVASVDEQPHGYTGFALARYNTEGTLDQTFGTGGKVLTDFSTTGEHPFLEGNAVALQPDGKIVVAGWSNFEGFALARYDADGTLDTSFGGTGLVTLLINGSDDNPFDQASGVAVQPDGKIVAAGVDWKTGSTGFDTQDFALVRFNPNGTIDTSFSGDGIVTTNVSPQASPDDGDQADTLVLEPDGKILAAGMAFDRGSRYDFALARYNPDGSLDTSFGGDGKVVTVMSCDSSEVQALALTGEGKIVAAGSAACYPGIAFAVARYNPDGSLDPTLGGIGKVVTTLAPNKQVAIARGVVVQPDGKIVAGGYADMGPKEYLDYDFAAVRYLAVSHGDTTPPETTITKGPSGRIHFPTATFAFRSSEPGSRFQCKLDAKAWKGCSSPKTYATVSAGNHVFRVRATDAAGNVDPTPARRSFKVVW